ncbi:MAG: TraR/DksA family transcriptional regulator [Sphingobacteriia bacterium]|jgi:RNA polymerase-binding transcription factor DksA|nr:TraR/DksA family transcriptional regulator [Sphingobacteriia bacterium]
MDDADLAQQHTERATEHAIAAARRAAQLNTVPASTHCSDCGEELEAHRRARGRCVPCQTGREMRLRAYAVGV